MLNGAKTWCTFAGKADVIVVIARTDTDRSKDHKGLSMFMVEKPRFAGHEFSREIPQADAWWVAQFLQLAIAVCILLTCPLKITSYQIPHWWAALRVRVKVFISPWPGYLAGAFKPPRAHPA